LIVVDSSAVVAILFEEPNAQALANLIDGDGEPHISAASVLECSIVVRSSKKLTPAETENWIDEFLDNGNFLVEPVDLDQLALARSAHLRFGKGTGHGAALNFGDCFSYALAKQLNVPLLYKGSDFAKTDIASVL
jgi:ribonuclease VapC